MKPCPKCGGDLHWDPNAKVWICLESGALLDPLIVLDVVPDREDDNRLQADIEAGRAVVLGGKR